MTERVDLWARRRLATPRHLTMGPNDHSTPFDRESEPSVDDAGDVTEQFWGDARGWDSVRRRTEPTGAHRDDTTGTMRAIRDGVAAFRPQRVELRDHTGQVQRTRVHGEVRDSEPPTTSQRRAEASIGDLAAGHFDDDFDDPFDRPDHDEVPLSPVAAAPRRLSAVDPLLVRLGAMVLVGVLLVPVALALRPVDAAPDTVLIESPSTAEAQTAPANAAGAAPAAAPDTAAATDESAEATSTAAEPAQAPAAPAPAPAAAPSSESSDQQEQTTEPAAASATSSSDTAEPSSDSESIGDVTQSATASGGIDEAATVDESAERVEPSCPQTYIAGAGDSWYRIAAAAGVSPDAVMTENRATVDTVIFAGDEICLPADATVPAQPTTTTPDTTDAPATTAPATTVAPTTTNAPAPPASVEEVKALIRATWPTEEHDTAMMIAQRESRFDPRADNNWCCYGVFQIYFEVHKGWLDDFGVYSATDLFDAEKNIAAAYHLYQQAGGWGPWGF